MRFVFGPVRSRRLGYSLGIELVPAKYCTYNCLYCESGKTTLLTSEIKPYVATSRILSELKQKVESTAQIDWLTITGAGEPTLNENIGSIINAIKKEFDYPLAVITNSSLLTNENVRNNLMNADLVMPSMDTAIEETFSKMLLPEKSLKCSQIIASLTEFTKQYTGQVWLEIIFVEGYNDSEKEVSALIEATKQMRVDRVYLGTVYRPPAFSVSPISNTRLEEIRKIFNEEGFDVI